MPDVSIRTDIGFEEDLMRSLISGALDIGMMYTPQHSPGLLVEHIFDETLLLLSTDPDRPWPNDDYIFVDWAPVFTPNTAMPFPTWNARRKWSISVGWHCN